MKKLLFAFFSIVSILWFMPIIAFAAYTAPDGNEYEYRFYASTGDYNTRYYTIYTNNKVCRLSESSNWNTFVTLFPKQNSSDKVCATMITSVGSYLGDDGVVKYPSGGVVSNQNNDYGFYVWENGNVVPSRSDNLYDYNTINSTDVCPIFSNAEQCYNYLITPDIDYDDLIFDPSIPVPKYTSIYGILPLWNLGGSVTPQFPIQTIFSSMQQYNIEVQVRYYSPSKITFNGSRRSAFSEDWTVNYNYDSLMPSEWYPLVTMQDNIQNNNLALNDSDYYYSWNNFITGYDSELIEFVLDPVFISATANTSIKAYAETEYSKMRNIGGCYGNQFEIMARNYYVNNGNVFVGNWFHWNSLTPDMGTAEYSNDAIQDNEVNGVQNIVNTSELPTGNSLTTIGQPTGNAYNPSNNIIINTNVPNYPDYPTIADYNRDNLFVGFIKTAKSMPQYLGEFNDFLKMAFSFIDPSVWAVISLGFGASIVIMIIKVL